MGKIRRERERAMSFAPLERWFRICFKSSRRNQKVHKVTTGIEP